MIYRRTIYPNELYHHGVKGMHWGVRRYQNYDGTRIGAGSGPVTRGRAIGSKSAPDGSRYRVKVSKSFRDTIVGGQGGKAEGNARLAASAKDAKKSVVDVVAGPEVKKGKGKDNSSHAKEIFNDLANAAEGAGNVAQDMKKRDKNVQQAVEKQNAAQRQKAKQMSDKELRDSINRIRMEREYISLTTKEVETGYDKFQDVMKDVKDIAVTAGAIAGLVLSIIKIKQALGHSDEFQNEQINDLIEYCVDNGFDESVITHAIMLDLDYILDFYELSEEDVQHILDSEEELYHHGILGQKWGVRRYQNYDGTRIGGGGSKTSNSFRDTIVGGQGGKATGTARLAASSKNVSINSRLSEVRKRKPKSYDLQDRAYEHARLTKTFLEEKDPSKKKAIEAKLSAHEKESIDLYNANEQYRKELRTVAGSSNDYVRNPKATGKEDMWIKKNGRLVISSDEYDYLRGYENKKFNPLKPFVYRPSDKNLKDAMTKRMTLEEINRRYKFDD